VHGEPSTENWGDSRREYLVLYLFDSDGYYIRHNYWYGGTTTNCDRREFEAKRQEMLAELGEFEYCDIAVRPFSVQIDNITFGLIPNADDESVELEPSSQISFMEPWDGEYYT
jgi:formate hydrogenlyase regulatory protein HycA